jgi:hypothetical protein
VSRIELFELLKPKMLVKRNGPVGKMRDGDSARRTLRRKTNYETECVNIMSAIDLLLQGKQHPNAVSLLTFHRKNPEFFPRIVAEFRLLKQLGRKAGSIESLIHFLRWEQHWHGDSQFEINDQLTALAARVCALLWPDIGGMLKFSHCEADEILDTSIGRRGKHGNFLSPGRRTLPEGSCFLPPEPDATGAGFVRPIRTPDYPAPLMPPPVPILERPGTIHVLISEEEAAPVAGRLREIVNNAPNPKHPILLAWLGHAEGLPEMFAFMQAKLQQRKPAPFSPRSILEYCRWSIGRAAVSHKKFTLPAAYNGLYSRALVILNPQFNGFCKFKHDGEAGRSNRLLGCTLASKPVNGEPYCPLIWAKGGK